MRNIYTLAKEHSAIHLTHIICLHLQPEGEINWFEKVLHGCLKKKVKHITIIIYPLTVRVVGGTTDDFTTSLLHFPLFSTALRDLANSRPVHSLMLSSHLFLLY